MRLSQFKNDPTTIFSLVGCAFVLTLAACTSLVHDVEKAVYYDAAFDDKNRAPLSLNPPAQDNSEVLDKTQMHTQADYYFSLGEAMSYEGNHQKALESFKMVLIYDKESSVVYLRIATEYVKIGLISQALENAELAIEKDPQFTDGRMFLGHLYSTIKAPEKALQQYEKVLKINPEHVEAPLYIGAVLAEQKKYDKAVKYFESLTKNEDFQAPHLVYYYIGRVRSEQDGVQFKKAAENAFKKALELKPEHAESVLSLGNLYTKLGQEQRALDLYRTYQKEYGPSIRLAEVLAQIYLEQEKYDLAFEQLEILENNSEDALNIKVKMALILIEQKDYKKAIAKLQDVLAQVPDSDKIRYYLAAVYEEIGQGTKAVEQFQKVPSTSQFFSESIVHATYILKQQKKIDDAEKIVRNAVENRDDLPQLVAVYASILDEKNDHKKALEILKKGVIKFPEHVQLQFFFGTVHDKLGNKDAVISSMKKVIEMDPNHVQGLNYLAYTYSEMGIHMEDAEALAKRALALDPKDAYVLDTYGWVLFKKGENKQAIKVLESALNHQPNESVIAEHLGDAYFKAQMLERARTMYERAAENETSEVRAREIRSKISSIERQEVKTERLPASAATQQSP
jgi:tetratricopeptide (TPR) repeat protein